LAEDHHQFFVMGDCWQYSVSGSGNRIMVLLHGYGQNIDVFHHLEELIASQFKLVKIDLAYHGHNQTLSDSFIFSRDYCNIWMEELRKGLGITQFSLVGFSIGARIAMGIASWFPKYINELWLIAPDGLPISKAYIFLTQTSLGVTVFKDFVKNPWVAHSLIYLGEKLKVISARTAKFYLHEIESVAKRQQLFNTWMAYRYSNPNYALLTKFNEDKLFSITCYLGKEDSIIPFKRTQNFIRKHLKGAQIIALNSGHNILSEKGIKRLKEYWDT
jgi:pimeloyl-ACP methyl ester carboxylesterase